MGFCGRECNGTLESRQNANNGLDLSRLCSVHISVCVLSPTLVILCVAFLMSFFEMLMASFIFTFLEIKGGE